MAIQPNHRFTHSPVYIFPGDNAWDVEKINYEMDLIAGAVLPPDGEPCPWEAKSDHPVVRFRNGSSRFDLDTVADYLLPGTKPTRVELRRFSLGHWQNVQSTMEREVTVHHPVTDTEGNTVMDAEGNPVTVPTVHGRTESLVAAIRFGVEAIADCGIKAARAGLADLQIESLREQIGDHYFMLLGYACLALNRSLTVEESFH